MKIRINARTGEKKYEYDYKIIYTDNETHQRIKDYSSKRRLKINDGIKELLDFYEKEGSCRCIKN